MNYNVLQPTVGQLRNRQPLPSLAPKQVWDTAIDNDIMQCSSNDLAGGNANRIPYADAFKAGLHLMNESLELSHNLSQEVHNSTGSYWHGIMHRMEADYSNSHYWFHLVGDHPAYKLVLNKIKEMREANAFTGTDLSLVDQLTAQDAWNPYLFVDLVERAMSTQNEDAIAILEQVQHAEMQVLLDYTYRQCIEGA